MSSALRIPQVLYKVHRCLLLLYLPWLLQELLWCIIDNVEIKKNILGAPRPTKKKNYIYLWFIQNFWCIFSLKNLYKIKLGSSLKFSYSQDSNNIPHNICSICFLNQTEWFVVYGASVFVLSSLRVDIFTLILFFIYWQRSAIRWYIHTYILYIYINIT